MAALALLVSAAFSVITVALPAAPASASVSDPISRSDILTRARSWVDINVKYTQFASYTNQYGTYRKDCSGFVSMAWNLGTSAVTWTLDNYGYRLGSYDDLQPGDAVLGVGAGHVVLFVSWTSSSHTTANVYEETSYTGASGPDPGSIASTYSRSYLSNNGYVGLRRYNVSGEAQPPAVTKYWVDTFANASGYASPTSTTATGTLFAATNYVFCKAWGRVISDSSGNYNHWWLKTDLDVGPANQYVSAYYLTRWGNDEAKDNNGVVIPTCAGGDPPPPPAPTKYWVDTFANAPGYASATSTTQTGTLYAGTNYVFCKVWGRQISDSSGNYNHWWLKTDLDVGPANQYVSAYYLTRWGNDEAKDNNGSVIPNC